METEENEYGGGPEPKEQPDQDDQVGELVLITLT